MTAALAWQAKELLSKEVARLESELASSRRETQRLAEANNEMCDELAKLRRRLADKTKQVCPDCDGSSFTRGEEWDEHGSHVVDVRCEGCNGTGELTECIRCREVVPADMRECEACAQRDDSGVELRRVG